MPALPQTGETCSTIREWGDRLIKLDFMDTTAIEGQRHRPDTTGLEAVRISLEAIRAAVGEDVILDKDGGPMLTPAGLVDPAGFLSMRGIVL
jgi:alpha-galactosidase